MIRIGKMTDYGIVILSYLAKVDNGKPFSAKDLAELSKIPHSTVSQILKALAKVNILRSQRGLHGGYLLNKNPAELNLAQIIGHLEGPITITDCALKNDKTCIIEASCPTKENWKKINTIVFEALEKITLKDMNHTVPLTIMSGDNTLETESINEQKQSFAH